MQLVSKCTRPTWDTVQASDAAAREQLEKVVECLITERCHTFEDCIAWARHRLQVCEPAQ